MPLIILPGERYVAIIGQKLFREKVGIDVMAQIKASVLKAHWLQDAVERGLQLMVWVSPTLNAYWGSDGCPGVGAGWRRTR